MPINIHPKMCLFFSGQDRKPAHLLLLILLLIHVAKKSSSISVTESVLTENELPFHNQ